MRMTVRRRRRLRRHNKAMLMMMMISVYASSPYYLIWMDGWDGMGQHQQKHQHQPAVQIRGQQNKHGTEVNDLICGSSSLAISWGALPVK